MRRRFGRGPDQRPYQLAVDRICRDLNVRDIVRPDLREKYGVGDLGLGLGARP